MRLTPKQNEFLEFLQSLPDSNVAPSFRELANLRGTCPSSIHRYMVALKQRGYLDYIPGGKRTWKLK